MIFIHSVFSNCDSELVAPMLALNLVNAVSYTEGPSEFQVCTETNTTVFGEVGKVGQAPHLIFEMFKSSIFKH